MLSLINYAAAGGEGEAMVELELYRSQEPNTVVATTIAKNRHPPKAWSINGREVDRAELSALTDSLQIQPGNLCQFLPQDVVR